MSKTCGYDIIFGITTTTTTTIIIIIMLNHVDDYH